MKPILDASISSQLHDVLEVADTEIENCQSARIEIRSALNSLLKVLNLYCSEWYILQNFYIINESSNHKY